MDEGLFPKKTIGWVFLVILVILYGYIYYGYLYNDLSDKYFSVFETENLWEEESADRTISVTYPNKISGIEKNRIVVKLLNGRDPLEKMQFGLLTDKKYQDVIEVSLEMEGGNLKQPPSYVFENIPPEQSSIITFIIIIKSSNDIEPGEKIRLGFQIDQTEVDDFIDLVYAPDPLDTAALIQSILVPPWSNGLLIVVALIVVKLTEDYLGLHHDDNKNGNHFKKNHHFLYIFIPGRINVLPNMVKSVKGCLIIRIIVQFLLLVGYSLVIFGGIYLAVRLASNYLLAKPIFFIVGLILVLSGYGLGDFSTFCMRMLSESDEESKEIHEESNVDKSRENSSGDELISSPERSSIDKNSSANVSKSSLEIDVEQSKSSNITPATYESVEMLPIVNNSVDHPPISSSKKIPNTDHNVMICECSTGVEIVDDVPEKSDELQYIKRKDKSRNHEQELTGDANLDLIAFQCSKCGEYYPRLVTKCGVCGGDIKVINRTD